MLNNMTRRFSLGFTLVELLIGVAILGILLSFAIPEIRTWIQNTQVRGAADSVLSGLQRARAEAVTQNISTEFQLASDGSSSWVVKRVVGGVTIESRTKGEGSVNVKVTTVPANSTTVSFSNFGFVIPNSDASATATEFHFDSLVLNATENHQMQVRVSTPGGRIRMCDPHSAAGTASAC